MRGVAKMLEYKQKRNNGRTPFAGVYKFVCVCVTAEHVLWQSQSYGDRDVPITVLKYDFTVVVGTF